MHTFHAIFVYLSGQIGEVLFTYLSQNVAVEKYALLLR